MNETWIKGRALLQEIHHTEARPTQHIQAESASPGKFKTTNNAQGTHTGRETRALSSVEAASLLTTTMTATTTTTTNNDDDVNMTPIRLLFWVERLGQGRAAIQAQEERHI